MKKLKKLLLEILVAVMLSFSPPAMTMAADTGVPGAMCQSAGVWQGLIKNICWSCIFPMRIMGTVLGASTIFSSLGMAFGPAVGGWIYDTTGGYGWLYIASAGMGLGAMLIALLFPPFPSQRQVPQPA